MATACVRRFGCRAFLAFTLAWVLAFNLAAPAGATGQGRTPATKVHPALEILVNHHPLKRVPVIVQKADPRVHRSVLAGTVGAAVDDDFQFIHSFRVTLPAVAIARLARHPSVRYISPDSPVQLDALDITALQTVYPQVVGAPGLWDTGTELTAKGVTVAVVDSGVETHPDFGNRLLVRWAAKSTSQTDQNGHGTHVAGTIAGRSTDGRYIGVAPAANMVAVKTANDKYQTSEASVVTALQWA